MVREARFSWDDIEPLDPGLRNERPDDFDGPDDDWIRDLKRTARRRDARKRRHKPRPPGLDQTADASATAVPRPHPNPRRHLSGADWLDLPDRAPPRGPRRPDATDDSNGAPFPPDPLEAADDVA